MYMRVFFWRSHLKAGGNVRDISNWMEVSIFSQVKLFNLKVENIGQHVKILIIGRGSIHKLKGNCIIYL